MISAIVLRKNNATTIKLRPPLLSTLINLDFTIACILLNSLKTIPIVCSVLFSLRGIV